ncbi:MAG: hypothetical protein JJT94_09345 [Bernardetiaceae bacterium]|nr:hypothetical protein [Bernardetiaceae bacterium]
MIKEQALDLSKISIFTVQLSRAEVNNPTSPFDATKIKKHLMKNSIGLALNFEQKSVKTEFFISLQSDSEGANPQEAIANFAFIFVFKVENLAELAENIGDGKVNMSKALELLIHEQTYSTARGILCERLKHTPLKSFILPIYNPKQT